MDSLLDRQLLAGNLTDLRRVNTWLGGRSLTRRALQLLTQDMPAGSTVDVLDVATGGADMPAAMMQWLASRGLQPRVVGSDASEAILALAAEQAPPQIELVRADARSLPFADGSFDVATCSLAIHHFEPGDAVSVLREMARVSRRGVVVNDLLRCWHGYAGAVVLGRLFTSNHVTRHDGMLSIRRAYTLPELKGLLTRAGLRQLHTDSFLGVRVALSAVPARARP